MKARDQAPHERVDHAVEDRVRELESGGVDAKDIAVVSPLRGTVEETRRTGTSQLSRPLGRAAFGVLAGVFLGALAGAAVGSVVDLFVPILVLGAVAGALLGGLNGLYARLPMSSKAFDADGASAARIEIHENQPAASEP